MSIKELQAVVLAAGKSTRFRTGKSKLVEKICGREMILYVTKLLEHLNIPTTLVIGYQRDLIKKIIKKHHGDTIDFVVQEQPKGTGHAILCAQPHFNKNNILIINGDMPLIPEAIIQQLYDKHIDTNATVSFVISHNSDLSTGAYGRIIQKDNMIEIIEAKDFHGDEHEHCFINAGIYIIKREFLDHYVNTLSSNNASNEFYITDLVKIASEQGFTISTVSAPFDRIRGINTFRELWVAEQIKRADTIKHWMERGVRFSLAQSVHIDWDVQIGAGSVIDCSVHLLSGTKIGTNCVIKGFSTLSNAKIGNNTTVYPHSIIDDSFVGNNTKIGPFACVHEKANIGDNSIIGNFVEVRASEIGHESSAKHLTYLAHAQIGTNVTIGAGTITCNHDGQQYQKTTIKDNSFIGSNNSIVAPVTIEKNTFTAAGAIISENITNDNEDAHKHNLQLNKKLESSKNTDSEQSCMNGTTKKGAARNHKRFTA